jgi:hypothetical protein
LHGASASSATFEVPRWGTPASSRGLVDYLTGQGFEVWALDWRGGHVVGGRPRRAGAPLTLDEAAKHDVPAALAAIRERIEGGLPILAVGHCMGAAALAMSIGAGYVTAKELPAIVLTSIGLFYEVRWDGWIKADDQALERSLIEEPATAFVHCDAANHRWPPSLEKAFDVWPDRLLPLPGVADHPFKRLTFMFGRPWLEGLVAAEDQDAAAVLARFGAMPIELYIQCGQNVRRGFAAPLDDASWGAARSEPRVPPGRPRALDRAGAGKYLNHDGFRGMRVTLITGELNLLWHPDSIRRMYEWLKRDRAVRVDKHVLAGYGHQDLYWAKSATRDVYPRIAGGLLLER